LQSNQRYFILIFYKFEVYHRKLFLRTRSIILSFFVIFFLSGQLKAKTCPLNIAPPSVTLSTSNGEISIHTGYSSQQLDSKLGGQSMANLHSRWVTRGLTKSKLESRILIGVTYTKNVKNEYCIGLRSVAVQIGYPSFDIYVARKLKPGSCSYNTTMAHEQKHVEIYRAQLQRFLPWFRRQLNQSVKKIPPILSSSLKAGNKYFLGRLNIKFKSVLKQMNDETDRLQRRMDTPKNYRKEQKLCPSS
jgi:hypothetical protein